MSHPIENIMSTTMDSIRDMIDVNTVIGEPIVAENGATIIPVSRVSFGFVAGGGEYEGGNGANKNDSKGGNNNNDSEQPPQPHPFAGGTGAGVSVQPVCFLTVTENAVKMLPIQHNSTVDRLVELIPTIVNEVKESFGDRKKESSIFEEEDN